VIFRRYAALATALLVCVPAAAALGAPAAAPSPAPAASPEPAGGDAVTHHTVTIDGKTIAYTAHAGTIPLVNADGDEIAQVFSVAYTVDGADPHTRPVTFMWNGGPGSSSMWLHMASFGPVRVAIPGNAAPPQPNTPWGANPDSLLDVSDLVFVDAVGTGYSRISGKGKATDFFGIDEDAKAFDQFIKAWTTRNGRWPSPKFLFGESYGTTRAADVVNRLQNDGMGIDGVVLLSSVLDFNALDDSQGPGEDLGNIAFLPTEAAVAWYHHALPHQPADLPAFLDQVRAFAIGPYADAMMRGDALDGATRARIVATMHEDTGLSTAYIERAHLRLDPSRFEHELLHDQGIVTGRLDGRYQGQELDRTGDSSSYDPTSDDGLADAVVAGFHAYARDDLHYTPDRAYLPSNYPVVGAHWNNRTQGTIVAGNVAGDLREALVKNPYLHVFSANGWFDLATPFFGTQYTLDHLNVDAATHRRISYGFYPSGHMVYLNDEARRALKADLVRFYHESVTR
jgi:carboxypeptidase C (cathepsin A)